MPTEEESYIRWGVIDHKMRPTGEETTRPATDLEKFLMGLELQRREKLGKEEEAEEGSEEDASS